MIRRQYRRWLVTACVFVLPLLWTPAAHAISMIKIREVYPGSNNDSYVELQAYASFIYAGNTLPGKSVVLLDKEGHPTIRFTFTEANNLGSDNTMFLVGDTGVPATFGVTPDVTDPGMEIDPAGGAACWNVGDTPVDCVSWGDFTGEAALEEYSGTSAGNPADPNGIPPGKAITRLITPNCPTWLEAEDDTDDSATDFVDANPSPHPAGDFNFGPESPCFSGMPENTKILEEPSDPSSDSSPHFTYSAATATSYQCKLDNAPRFTACPNEGQSYSGLGDGTHTFQVRGLNSNGPDKAPALYTWTVDTQPPTSSFLSHPGVQSFGKKASFTFASNEPTATFRCALDAAPTSPCQSGITVGSLTSGQHTFSVVAVDAAGNVQRPPTVYRWTVDADPPRTTIDSRPDGRTSSRSATFTYHANRPDTVFECSMDAEEFSSCPKIGATYTELTEGPHTFSVRAIDSDNEVEGNPPSYSFTVGPPLPGTCKKGYRRKVVKGVSKCVRTRHHRHHHRRIRGRRHRN
jgi:hypothetical protein